MWAWMFAAEGGSQFQVLLSGVGSQQHHHAQRCPREEGECFLFTGLPASLTPLPILREPLAAGAAVTSRICQPQIN